MSHADSGSSNVPERPDAHAARERRACPRYTSAVCDVELAYASRRVAARVVDASVGGMALWVAAVPDLQPEQPVDIVGEEGVVRAKVKHITALETDGFQVGLAWA